MGLVICPDCRNQISDSIYECPHCGCAIEPYAPPRVAVRPYRREKSRVGAALLAFFTGSVGIHRFYLGRPLSGVLYLVFCWTFIPTILGFVETIRLALMDEEDFHRKYSV